MLLDDQGTPQRNHHQDAQQAADDRDHCHLAHGQVVAHQQNGGERKHDPRRDGLTGRAGGLHDVVLQDRGFAQGPEERDRQYRNRNRGGDGEPDLEGQVDARRREHHTQDRAENHRADRQLGRGLRGDMYGLNSGVTGAGVTGRVWVAMQKSSGGQERYATVRLPQGTGAPEERPARWASASKRNVATETVAGAFGATEICVPQCNNLHKSRLRRL